MNKLLCCLFIFITILNKIKSDNNSSISISDQDKNPKIDYVYHNFDNCKLNIYIFSKIYNKNYYQVKVNYNNQIFSSSSGSGSGSSSSGNGNGNEIFSSNGKSNQIKYLNEQDVLFNKEIKDYISTTSDKEYLKIILIQPLNVIQESNITIVQSQNNNNNNITESTQTKLLKLKSSIICNNSNIKERILELNGILLYSNYSLMESTTITIEAVRQNKLYHQCKVFQISNSTIKCILDKSFFSGCIERIKIKNLIGFDQQYIGLYIDDKEQEEEYYSTDYMVCSQDPIIKKVYLHQDAVSRSFKATIIGSNFSGGGGVEGILLLECKNQMNNSIIQSISDQNSLDSFGNTFSHEYSSLHDHIVIFTFPDEVSDVLELNDYSKKSYYNYLIIRQHISYYNSSTQIIPISWDQVVVNNSDSKLIGLIAIPGSLFMVAIVLATTLLFKSIYKKDKNKQSYQINGASEDNIENNNDNSNQNESNNNNNNNNTNNNNQNNIHHHHHHHNNNNNNNYNNSAQDNSEDNNHDNNSIEMKIF